MPKGGRGLKWPHGVVSKAQWRFLYAKAKTDPKFKKIAHQLTERNETQMPGGTKGHKADWNALPWRRRGPTGTTLRKK